jgi:hypothetical protein
MTRYDWRRIPKEYKWVAKDSNGTVKAYSERPGLRKGYWASSFGGTEQLGCSPRWESDSDWEDSLEERPKPAKRYELTASGVIMDRAVDNWLTLVEVVDRLNEYEDTKRGEA